MQIFTVNFLGRLYCALEEDFTEALFMSGEMPGLSFPPSCSYPIHPHHPRFMFQVSVGHNVHIPIGKNQKLWQRLKKANDIPLMFIRPKTYKRFP